MTDPGIVIFKIAAVLVLVLLNGFFVAAEFAIVKIRDTQLNPLIQKGNRRAKVARHVLANLDRYLSAAQLGITLASLGLGALGEPVFAALLQPVMDWLHIDSPKVRHTLAVAIGLTILTFLHITAGEQAPKWMAIQKPLATSLWVVYPLKWFYLLTYPFIWVLNHSSLWMLRQIGIQPASEAELVHSEEELRLLFAGSQKHSASSALGRDIVLNALDLRRRVVREVMRPRQEIVVLDTQASLAECIDIAEKTRFSRFPLCESGDLDRTLGVVHIKDLYAARFRAKTAADLGSVARRLIYVPETARLEKLLQLFLERKLHFAIVVDEFGGTVGMITIENVLEELVGQIQDEFDQEKPMIVKTGEQAWEILGTLPVHDFEELVGEPLAEEGVTTLSGWVTNRLGGFPKAGDTVRLGAYGMRVEEMDGLRVARLTLRRVAEEDVLASPTPGTPSGA
jgi:CBS domain containing-hemolysin-like protein